MTDYRDEIYSKIDAQFDKMGTGKDFFADEPIVQPTEYERGRGPAGWVSNASGADGTATVTIDAGGITILDGALVIKNSSGQTVGSDGVWQNGPGTVVINSTGITVTNGKITLSDQFGNNVLTGAGFGASWYDFIASGFYNNHFAVGTTNNITAATKVGTASTEADYLASLSSDVPYWVIDSESGAGTFKRVADSTAVGGFALQWSGTETAKIFQDIPIVPGQQYQVFISWRYTNSSSSFNTTGLGYQFRAYDHAAIGSVTTFGFSYSTSQAAYDTEQIILTDVAPADARFLRVIYEAARTSGSPTVWVNSFALVPKRQFGDFEIIDGELQFSTFGSAVDIYQYRTAAKTLTFDADHGDGALTKFRVPGALFVVGGSGSFPASPANTDIYYRFDTDKVGWYEYDGTRWNSPLREGFFAVSDNLMPMAATGTAGRIMLGAGSHSNVNLREWDVAFYVAGGGSALGASHKWVITLTNDAGTVWGTINIDSGASSTWRTSSVTVAQLMGTNKQLSMTATKTGTPGDLYVAARQSYHMVDT